MLIFWGGNLYSQNKNQEREIDSVFQFYFKVVQIELELNIVDYPEFLAKEYDPIYRDTIYYNKHLSDAIVFFETITTIKCHIKKDYSCAKYLSADIFEKWKKWYCENKKYLKIDNGIIFIDR